MKPLRREPAIFGVAAIDLFASALGAFIVVALVLLPHFPNTGDATLHPASATTELSEADTAEPPSAQTDPEAGLAREAGRSSVQSLPPVDLIIALDTTNSMFGEVASLREEVAGLAELLANLTDGAGVGIIDFKDGCEGSPALRVAPLQLVDGQSVQRLLEFARSMKPGAAPCNTSPDEDLAEALRLAVDSPWRPASTYRSIILISDNPAHSHLRRQAVEDARGFAARPGARHTVSTVFSDRGDTVNRSFPETAAYLQELAEAGDGRFVRSSESASLTVVILRALFG